jgi:MarR family transcriptional regulator, organic hydroperoxide resistance regulator
MDKSELIADVIKLDRDVRRHIRRYSIHAWMELTMTVPQLKTIFFVSNERTTNPRKLAKAMCVTPSNITGIVERLVEQNLLTREQNPGDRRVQTVRTTEQAEAIISNLREHKSESFKAILTRVSEDDLKSLQSGLNALMRAAEAYEKERKTSESKTPVS